MYVERASRRTPGAFGWRSHLQAGGASAVLPDGCMDLLWTQGRLLVAGPDTAAQLVEVDEPQTFLGLRLPPGTAPVLLGVPAWTMRDERVDLAQVWSAAVVDRWTDRLAATPGHGVDVLDRLVAERLAEGDPGPDATRATVALVRRGLGTGEVATRLGVTERTVHRRALDSFGYGLRTLSRVLRMQRAIALLAAGTPPAQVAAQAGYADQPHLSRELRALTGRSPGQLAPGSAANRSTVTPSGSSSTA